MTNKKYVAAIDQGTTSTRCIIFDHNGEQAAVGQLEHEQICLLYTSPSPRDRG